MAQMMGLRLARTMTIGGGNEVCDFRCSAGTAKGR